LATSSAETAPPRRSLADLIDAALPQTQCTRCGFPDCRSYAHAMAEGQADINRCPPGGQEGVRRLSAITGHPESPLDPTFGLEGPLRIARIDEDWCIGCTLCIKACPVDCIVGASKQMHTVILEQCTGCELCIPACPVDCIELQTTQPALTGWEAWSDQQAAEARQRYQHTRERRARQKSQREDHHLDALESKLTDLPAHSRITDTVTLDRKRALIEAALERARRAREGS
jgi:Na+-translocating ferredoxin:NAD+ oxidoreductase subunit B